MQRRVWVGVGVVVVLAAGVVILAGGRMPWLADPGCRIVQPVDPGPAASATAAPGGGGLRVVEQGSSRADRTVSAGAIVQNTSHATAFHAKIAFTVQGRDWQQQEIPVLLPGQRIGVGAEGVADAGAVAVSLRTATWLAADALGADFAPVTATYLHTIRPPHDKVTLDIHYTEHVPACRGLIGADVAVVLRDAGGRIVGGATELAGLLYRNTDVAASELRPPRWAPCSRGDHELWAVLGPPRPAVATTPRAELYPYCGV